MPNELFFKIFSSLEESPKDLLKYRVISKKFKESITAFICTQLSQLKKYPAGFKLIEKAVDQIPQKEDLDQANIGSLVKIFNEMIAGYKEVIGPFPVISSLQEVQMLEQQLENHSLQQLWEALWSDALPDNIVSPQLQTIDQKREWLEDKRNQPFLERVSVLELQGKRIVQLPREIFKLRNLKKLYLSENLIEVLPESIKIWTKLEVLNLFDNKLTYLPRSIRYLSNLTELYLGDNVIEVLPESIKGCTELKVLNFFTNRLMDLSPIGYLKKLVKLDVSFNELKELAKEFTQCVCLTSLKISGNQIAELPIEMKNLTSLRKLFASDNKLTTLCEELCSWNQIKKVDLSNNPLKDDITVDFIKTLWPTVAVYNKKNLKPETF